MADAGIGMVAFEDREARDASNALARKLYDSDTDVATICTTLGISRATLYRALKAP